MTCNSTFSSENACFLKNHSYKVSDHMQDLRKDDPKYDEILKNMTLLSKIEGFSVTLHMKGTQNYQKRSKT